MAGFPIGHKIYFCKLQLMLFGRFASCIAIRFFHAFCLKIPQNHARHGVSFKKAGLDTNPGAD